MTSWECQSCGYRYDPAKGDDTTGIAPGIPFEKLPRTWRCPRCKAEKDEFEEADPDPDEDEGAEEDLEDEEAGGEEEEEEAFSEDFDEDEPEDENYEEFAEDEADAGEMEDDGEEAGDEDEEVEEEEGSEDEAGFEDDEDLSEDDEAGEPEVEDESEPEDDEAADDDTEEDGDEIETELEDDDAFEEFDEEVDEDVDEDEEEALDEDTRYICTECAWVYDPAMGHPESGVLPGTPFDDLAEDWVCPACGATQMKFAPHEDAPERRTTVTAPGLSEKEPGGGFIGQMAETGRPTSESGLPRLLTPGLGELLFRPVPLFRGHVEETVTTLTLIGRRAERPLHLTTPIVVAPMPFGPLTGALKVAIAKATARVGTACTSGGPTLSEARRAASVYILEVAPGRPAPGPEELQACDAAEIILGRGWTHLEEDLAPGRSSGGVLAPVSSPEELKDLVIALRKSMRGPIGVRLPAGAIETDLELVMPARPDYLVIEGFGAGAGSVPPHVRNHANLPVWLAVHRARQFLDTRGHDEVGLIAAGNLTSPADMTKILALGADAVMIATAAVVAMGAWDLRPGNEPVARELLEMRFDANQAVERLVNFLRASTEEIMDFCRLAGKADVHELDRADLLTTSEELSRALGLAWAPPEPRRH